MAILGELRRAARGLVRAPAFSLVVLATLALGIGGATAIYSLVNGVLLRPLPFPHADRLAMVWETTPDGRNDRNPVNAGNYLRWRERTRAFASMSVMVPWTATLATGDGAPERLKIGYVSGEFFDTLGLPAIAGRGFVAEEATEGHDAVVVLSAGLWKRRFGGDPGVVGRDVLLDGERVRVVGVASPQADVPPGTEIWNPIGFGARHREARGRAYGVVGRLRPDVTLAAAQSEMSALARDLERERPEVDRGWGVHVVPLREQLVGNVRAALWILLGAFGALLAIACANLANLWLVRAAARRRELAVRNALGGGAPALARLPLLEAALLAAAGGTAGALVARLGLDALLRLAPTDVPRFLAIGVDGAALVFAALVALAVAASTAALPAWRAGRSDGAELLASSRGTTRDARAGRLFVLAQTGIACVLLVMAGLLGRSLLRLQRVDVGFRPEAVQAAQIDLAGPSYREPGRIDAFYATLLERARAIPGVAAAGAISWLPLGGPGSATGFHRADQPQPEPDKVPVAEVRVVAPGTFAALGVPLLGGRDFDGQDDARGEKRVVVSAALARDLFADRQPLGQRLNVAWGGGADGWACTIVGVVGDVRLTGLATPPRYAVYFPLAQSPNNFMTVVLRSALAPRALDAALRDALRTLDPQVATTAVRTLADVGGAALRQPRLLTFLVVTFAGAALALAALGVYGVLAYGLAARRREIGIRMAVGARGGDVARLVLRDGMRPALLGAGAGLLLAAAVVRGLRGVLYGVPPSDPWSWGAAVAALLLAAVAACALPALRAARTPPAAVLREE